MFNRVLFPLFFRNNAQITPNSKKIQINRPFVCAAPTVLFGCHDDNEIGPMRTKFSPPEALMSFGGVACCLEMVASAVTALFTNIGFVRGARSFSTQVMY